MQGGTLHVRRVSLESVARSARDIRQNVGVKVDPGKISFDPIATWDWRPDHITVLSKGSYPTTRGGTELELSLWSEQKVLCTCKHACEHDDKPWFVLVVG
jgi:hypothetical protein